MRSRTTKARPIAQASRPWYRLRVRQDRRPRRQGPEGPFRRRDQRLRRRPDADLRRLPKRGFNNIFPKDYNVVSLGRIQTAIDAGKLDATADDRRGAAAQGCRHHPPRQGRRSRSVGRRTDDQGDASTWPVLPSLRSRRSKRPAARSSCSAKAGEDPSNEPGSYVRRLIADWRYAEGRLTDERQGRPATAASKGGSGRSRRNERMLESADD